MRDNFELMQRAKDHYKTNIDIIVGQCRWTDQLQQQFQRQETDTVTERHKDSATETVPLRHSQKNTATVYKRETHIGCPESKLTT